MDLRLNLADGLKSTQWFGNGRRANGVAQAWFRVGSRSKALLGTSQWLWFWMQVITMFWKPRLFPKSGSQLMRSFGATVELRRSNLQVSLRVVGPMALEFVVLHQQKLVMEETHWGISTKNITYTAHHVTSGERVHYVTSPHLTSPHNQPYYYFTSLRKNDIPPHDAPHKHNQRLKDGARKKKLVWAAH